MNPFWLTLVPSPDGVLGALSEFIQFNRWSASAAVVWDLLKAFLRGCLIREITGIKNRSREWEDRVRDEMRKREQALVTDPSQSNNKAWTEAQSLYNSTLMSTAEKRRYFLQQSYFEEGDNSGQLLALVAREQRVHRDQSGFIPTQFTADNIRHLFVNLQIPVDNPGGRAILSLDASRHKPNCQQGQVKLP